MPRELYLSARMRLPQPWSRWLSGLAHIPELLRGEEHVRVALAEELLTERLMADGTSLENVGRGLSERVVEVPWVLRSLSAGQHVLDVGTAFAPPVYKRLLVRSRHDVETVDLAEGGIRNAKNHVADVRSLPFADMSFDAAICISTLEHIGMDNEHYGIASGGDDDVQALRELGRVARRVFITVPAGSDADLGWLRQYAPATFRARVLEAGLSVDRMDVFAQGERGWHSVAENSVGDRHFGEGAYAAAALICTELS